MTEEPTAAEVAEWAMTIASAASAELRAKAATADTALFDEARKALHLASKESRTSARDEETWIRFAAMDLLVGLAATSRERETHISDDGDATVDIGKIWRALAEGRLDEAETAATNALDNLAPDDPQRGNVIHHAHLVLGYTRLRAGDVDGAAEHLLAAGQTPGSPQLNSFGPNMSLALALLQEGRSDVVLHYFDECAAFWGKLPQWRAKVQAGQTPDFGANLVYGIPEDVHTAI